MVKVGGGVRTVEVMFVGTVIGGGAGEYFIKYHTIDIFLEYPEKD